MESEVLPDLYLEFEGFPDLNLESDGFLDLYLESEGFPDLYLESEGFPDLYLESEGFSRPIFGIWRFSRPIFGIWIGVIKAGNYALSVLCKGLSKVFPLWSKYKEFFTSLYIQSITKADKKTIPRDPNSFIQNPPFIKPCSIYRMGPHVACIES